MITNQYADGFWNSDETWLFGVPTSTQNVTINNLLDVNNNAVINDVTVGTGGSISIEGGSSLTVNGDLTTNDSVILSSTSATFSSLIVNGTTNTGNISYNRYVDTNANGNDLVSSPVGGETFDASFVTNLLPHPDTVAGSGTNFGAYAFGPFDNTDGVGYFNYNINLSPTLESGVGYR